MLLQVIEVNKMCKQIDNSSKYKLHLLLFSAITVEIGGNFFFRRKSRQQNAHKNPDIPMEEVHNAASAAEDEYERLQHYE